MLYMPTMFLGTTTSCATSLTMAFDRLNCKPSVAYIMVVILRHVAAHLVSTHSSTVARIRRRYELKRENHVEVHSAAGSSHHPPLLRNFHAAYHARSGCGEASPENRQLPHVKLTRGTVQPWQMHILQT